MNGKEKLFIGGASLATGYILSSLLDGGIKHHAGLTCNGKPCTSLGCSDLAGCEAACHPNGGSFASEMAMCTQQAERAAGKPVTIPTGVGTAKQFGASVLGTSQACSDRLPAVDQDCCDFGGSGLNAALGGFPEQSCQSGKQIIKGVQGFGGGVPGCGVLEAVPIIGGIPCWEIWVGALALLVFTVIKPRL